MVCRVSRIFWQYMRSFWTMAFSPLFTILPFHRPTALYLSAKMWLYVVMFTVMFVKIHRHHVDRSAALKPPPMMMMMMMMIFAVVWLQGGIYWVVLMDTYVSYWSLLVIGFLTCIAVAWVYTVPAFSTNIRAMLGREPGWWWKFCWKFISPLIILVSTPQLLTDFYYPQWGCLPQWMLGYTPRADTPRSRHPLGRHPPQPDTPRQTHSLGRHPHLSACWDTPLPGPTPPWADISPLGGHIPPRQTYSPWADIPLGRHPRQAVQLW